MNRLSKAQCRALDKLDVEEWKSAYELNESISTLDALVRRNFAEKKTEPGYMFSRRVHTLYRSDSPLDAMFRIHRANELKKERSGVGEKIELRERE